MSMKRLNKEYCCSPSAKQYAHVLYELGISKEAVGETERLFEEVPVLEETFASPVVPMREKLSSIDKIFPEKIKNFSLLVQFRFSRAVLEVKGRLIIHAPSAKAAYAAKC